jgi:hypothetical protein
MHQGQIARTGTAGLNLTYCIRKPRQALAILRRAWKPQFSKGQLLSICPQLRFVFIGHAHAAATPKPEKTNNGHEDDRDSQPISAGSFHAAALRRAF